MKRFLTVVPRPLSKRCVRVPAIGARTEHLTGYPWLKVFTGRAWRKFRCGKQEPGWRLTEEGTGLSVGGSECTRRLTVVYGKYMLRRKTRRGILGRIAACRAGYLGKKIPKRFTYRSL